MKGAIPVKNPMLVISVCTELHLCPLWPDTNDASTMRIKLVENMFVNYVAKDFSHPIVSRNTCSLIVISRDFPVTFVANSSKMTRAIEDTWSVCMAKSILVKYAIRTFRPSTVLICIKEKCMVSCTKVQSSEKRLNNPK